MAPAEQTSELRQELQAAWHRYVDLLAPLRPALHGYCRRLTGNLWDAEDLVQETLLRGFGQWGVTYPEIREPRAYLLRTATNLWIDTLRRRATAATSPAAMEPKQADAADDPELSSHVRDAGAALLQRLAPQERAALLLKEVFDMPLEDIAAVLVTSTGAVKAALHRGRERLREPEATTARPMPSAALVDRFIDRLTAKDVAGLVALMLEGATAENVGNSLHVGLAPEDGVPHFFHKVIHGHEEWPPEVQWDASRVQRGEIEGEPVALYFARRRQHEGLTAVMRIEERDGHIARIRSYGFCPETVRAVGEMLGVRVFTGLYRAPTAVEPRS